MLVANYEEARQKGPGSFWFSADDKYLMIIVPGGHVAGISLSSWQWDGNREYPTITPSILVSDSYQELWHGYVRNGVLESV